MMRNVLHRLLSIMVMVSVAGWVQGCGRSELMWLRGNPEASEAMSGAFKGIREKVQDAVNQGTPEPSVSTYDPNCYANDATGRPKRNIFLTLSLMKLLEGNHTEEELGEMIFSISRKMTVVDRGQKVDVDLLYLISAADYWLVLDVVGADRIESEDAKKIFSILGIPFLSETHDSLLSIGRLISMDSDAYVTNWFNARWYLEQVPGDLYQRLMAEILPRANLEAWLTSLGFLSDEIDFILNRDIFKSDAMPVSHFFNTKYVGPDCNEQLPGLSWVAPWEGFVSSEISGKDPNEIRNQFFERRLEFWITWTGYYCPSPTPSPTPPVLDWVYKPCPSPTPGDGTGKGGDPPMVFVAPSPTPQDFVTSCSNPAPDGATLLTACQILAELGVATSTALPALMSTLSGFNVTWSVWLPTGTTLNGNGSVTDPSGPIDGLPPSSSGYTTNYYIDYDGTWNEAASVIQFARKMVLHCGRFYLLSGQSLRFPGACP